MTGIGFCAPKSKRNRKTGVTANGHAGFVFF